MNRGMEMEKPVNDIVLRVEHLKKYYPVSGGFLSRGNKFVKAVDDVSFQIRRGETFGLVGESGCGKSTLGKALIRLHEPTSGEVWLNGVNIAALSNRDFAPYRRQIQIVFQDPSASLNPRHTIEAILAEPFIVHGLYKNDRAQMKKEVERLMELVGLDSYMLNKYPHELSGGQKQRVGIARTLALKPDLIVQDEPVSALDVSIQAQIINLMVDLQKELGLSYLFISHNLNVVYQISDNVGVMYLGRMMEITPYQGLYKNPAHPYTKALLSAIPQPECQGESHRIILEGDIPSPVNPPAGCRFHTRCRECMECCRREEPQLKEIAPGHFVACHLYD